MLRWWPKLVWDVLRERYGATEVIMTASGIPDHDSADASAKGAYERAEPMTLPGESRGADQSVLGFLDRIGAPGFADIGFDGSLPASPPRPVDLD